MIGLTPEITTAAVVRHGVLRLTFADGTIGEVEVLERMHGPVFEEARTPEGFAQVTVDQETGTAVWPGGADLAPDTLYERGPDRCLAGLPRERLTCRRAAVGRVYSAAELAAESDKDRRSSMTRSAQSCSAS